MHAGGSCGLATRRMSGLQRLHPGEETFDAVLTRVDFRPDDAVLHQQHTIGCGGDPRVQLFLYCSRAR